MMLFLLWDFSLLILQSYRLGPLIATLGAPIFDDVSRRLNV